MEIFPRNWEKLVFVICFGRFPLPAGCVVLLCFFSPNPCAMVGLFGNFFGRTGMESLGPEIFEGCACLAIDFDASNGEI